MLMNPNWSESQETKICLQEDPACTLVFPDFLKYLYTGKLHINHFLVLPLVTLADKYNVKDLVHLCVDYMCRHVVSATKHNQLVHIVDLHFYIFIVRFSFILLEIHFIFLLNCLYYKNLIFFAWDCYCISD